MQENLSALEAAINEDLGKPRLEAAAELSGLTTGVRYALDNLDEWTRPEKVKVVEDFKKGWDATVYRAPQGVVLIIGYVSAPSPPLPLSPTCSAPGRGTSRSCSTSVR